MSFIKNVIELISSPNHSRTTGFLIILLILAIVPLTVIVAQKQQELRQRAASACEDISSIKECTTFTDFAKGGSCKSERTLCKDNNIVYKCQ